MVPEKSSEARMSQLALEMRQAIAAVAGPRGWQETREYWLARAARRIGITYRQTKSLFYQECRDPRASVVQRVRDAALRHAKREASELADRFDNIAGAMHASDPDFYRQDVDALVSAARALRRLDSARNDDA